MLPSSRPPSLPLFSHPPLTLSPLFSFSYPSLPLEVGPLKSIHGVWGSAVSSPSGAWGTAPAEIDFDAF